QDTKYYDLLESGAAEATLSTSLLVNLVASYPPAAGTDPLAEVAQSRRKHKRISQDTTVQLCRNFVTPLEREDIEALSTALYKITKNVEKIAERLTIAPTGATITRVGHQLGLLQQAASVVEEMVRQLRPKSHGE